MAQKTEPEVTDVDRARWRMEAAEKRARSSLVHYFTTEGPFGADCIGEIEDIIGDAIEAGAAKAELQILEKLGVTGFEELGAVLKLARKAQGAFIGASKVRAALKRVKRTK